MAHVHDMRDSDLHFTIDPVSRTIKSQSAKNILIQYDHNSEIFTFEMPRYIEGHDMSLCNRVDIHFINVGGSGQNNLGIYEVDDFSISEDEENTMVWSWTISANATQLVGSLAFAFRFACLTEDVIDYAWSTSAYSGISISKGIHNSESVIEEYIDILEQWENKLSVGVQSVKQTTKSFDSGGVNVITVTLTNGRTSTFEVRNGFSPERGVDYWTDEDKAEILKYIYDSIPLAEGVKF